MNPIAQINDIYGVFFNSSSIIIYNPKQYHKIGDSVFIVFIAPEFDIIGYDNVIINIIDLKHDISLIVFKDIYNIEPISFAFYNDFIPHQSYLETSMSIALFDDMIPVVYDRMVNANRHIAINCTYNTEFPDLYRPGAPIFKNGKIIGISTSYEQHGKKIYYSTLDISNFIDNGPLSDYNFQFFDIRIIRDMYVVESDHIKHMFLNKIYRYSNTNIYTFELESARKIFERLHFHRYELKVIYKKIRHYKLLQKIILFILRRYMAMNALYRVACDFKAYIYRPISSDDESTELVRRTKAHFIQYQS